MKSLFLYFLVVLSFFLPLAVFVFFLIWFFPKNIALMIVSLSGLVVIVGGPFWVLQIEAFFRMKLNLPKKNWRN